VDLHSPYCSLCSKRAIEMIGLKVGSEGEWKVKIYAADKRMN
jgi:hypothetical protein